MSNPLTKYAYEKLINEDIDWLIANSSDCLERQHIIVVLKHQIKTQSGDLGSLTRCPDCDNLILGAHYCTGRSGQTDASKDYQTMTCSVCNKTVPVDRMHQCVGGNRFGVGYR